MESNETVILKLNHGELSALSYLVAFAVLNHPKLTPHENDLVTKISQLDPDAYTMWRASVLRAADEKRLEREADKLV
jgi:hypothetical protein